MIKKSVLFLVSILIILQLASCNYSNSTIVENNKNIISPEHELLSKMFFEVDSIGFFNWDTLYDNLNNNLNIYNVCWILAIYDVLDISIQDEYKEKLILFLDKIEDGLLDNKNLYDILRIAMLEKNIYGEIKNNKIFE